MLRVEREWGFVGEVDWGKVLPKDVLYEIFRRMDFEEIGRARLVCRGWCVDIWDRRIVMKLPMVFGANDWRKYFGEVGEEPELRSDIGKLLRSECPFWKGKKVWQTCLLTMIPKEVNGEPFCLSLLGELIKNPKQGNKTEYRTYSKYVKMPYGITSPSKSYWTLMTRDVLEGSRIKRHEEQKKLVVEHSKRIGVGYEIPKVIEAAANILMHHVKTGERLYNIDKKQWTYTRCLEETKDEYSIIVGSFAPYGLRIAHNNGFCGFDHIGVGVVRNMFDNWNKIM